MFIQVYLKYKKKFNLYKTFIGGVIIKIIYCNNFDFKNIINDLNFQNYSLYLHEIKLTR